MPAILKHVGRGARLARPLGQDEAREAMGAIVAGNADPVQIGGFLIALRMKGETAEELAGFALALKGDATAEGSLAAAGLVAVPNLVDVDLHADGRERRPSLALAAACVATACGARVVLRGAFGAPGSPFAHFANNDLAGALATLGVDPTRPVSVAARALTDGGVPVLDLATYAPRTAALLALRARLGVRTCVNSAVKLMDPLGAGRALVGIFHGPYHAPVSGAARLLGVARAAVVQAPGGLPEPQPDKPTRITLVDRDAPPPPADGDPWIFDGATAAVLPAAAPLPAAETPAALAALVDAVLRAPAEAPPGAVRATLLGAALILWAAGLAPRPDAPDALAAAHDALHSGRARIPLDVTRSCYA